MALSLKTYDESFLRDQCLLVNEIQKDWIPKPFAQTVNFYKKIFSGPDFIPKLNIYGFNENELLGLINTRIRKVDEVKVAMIEIFVKNNDVNVETVLFEDLLKRLKGEQVKTIRYIISDQMEPTQNIAKRLNFKVQNKITAYAKSPVSILESSINSSKSLENISITDYVHENDFESLLEAMVEKFGYNRDMWFEELTEMSKLTNLIIDWKLVRSKGQIISSSLLLLDKPDSVDGFLQGIKVSQPTDENKIINLILFHHLNAAKSKNIKTITITLNGPLMDGMNLYEKLGFKFSHSYSSILNLDPQLNN